MYLLVLTVPPRNILIGSFAAFPTVILLGSLFALSIVYLAALTVPPRNISAGSFVVPTLTLLAS